MERSAALMKEARTLFRQKDFAAAELRAKESVDVLIEQLGNNHVAVPQAMLEYVEILKVQKKDSEALDGYLEIAQLLEACVQEGKLPAVSGDLAGTYNNVAMLYYHTFRYRDAVPYFRKALAIWQQTEPASSSVIRVTEGNIQTNMMLAQHVESMEAQGAKIIKIDSTSRRPLSKEEEHNKYFANQ
eukprot:TRINITY_DN28253_c0_g1_i1.p1 TRINITY_DN28253_c0_g1~~TRINITY_DN28253_c0_g1_i1.p1  ORF type:complete len:186 (+),score=24.16 TRINITY_DN28253_c0_g1_i1:70-627(+)